MAKTQKRTDDQCESKTAGIADQIPHSPRSIPRAPRSVLAGARRIGYLTPMLQRIAAENGVVFYRSPLLHDLGVPHGFSTRLGGISPPPFDSLNLGNPNGCAIQDDYEHIWSNYDRLLEAVGTVGTTLCRVHQVHADRVVRVEADRPHSPDEKADALVTDDPAGALSVRVADCVPILLASSDGRQVAAVHAGWRGVVSEVALRAIDAMGIQPVDIRAAIGPCIGFDAFEVGPEVLDAFVSLLGDRAPIHRRDDGKGHVDLRGAVRLQLEQAGVGSAHIDSTDRCTVAHADEFFSHRRDQGVTGRMAAVIAPRPSSLKDSFATCRTSGRPAPATRG